MLLVHFPIRSYSFLINPHPSLTIKPPTLTRHSCIHPSALLYFVIDFPVTTPSVLDREHYMIHLDSLPVHPSSLYFASKEGKVDKVMAILRKNPNFEVNWRNDKEGSYTALGRACQKGHSVIVSILLAHPDIDVNLKDQDGWSPFMSACLNGHTSCVRLLLKDQRARVNEPNKYRTGPLYYAAQSELYPVMKWWMASGREIDLGTPGDSRTDAIGRAKVLKKTEVVTLLERFKENPAETRQAVRVEIGWYDDAAAEFFALAVFVSDELLQVNDLTPLPHSGSSRLLLSCPWSSKWFCVIAWWVQARTLSRAKTARRPSSPWPRASCGPLTSASPSALTLPRGSQPSQSSSVPSSSFSSSFSSFQVKPEKKGVWVFAFHVRRRRKKDKKIKNKTQKEHKIRTRPQPLESGQLA